MRLACQTAFIAGAGRGIGAAVAEAFARAGSNLVLASRTQAELEQVAQVTRALGAKSLVCECDVSRREKVEAAVETALAEFGHIDVLINCAAIYGPIGPLVENDLEAWVKTIQINLMGAAFCMHAVLPSMIARRTGTIINFSGGGAVSPFPRFSAYSASKAAIVRLTETVAEEVKEFNIRVNTIAPGAVNTRLLDQILAAGEKAGRETYTRAHEQKRNGGTPPEHAAELAVFLASEAARGLTGRLISAVWDDWKSLPSRLPALSESAFTLRRIDGRNFTEIR